MTLRAHGGSKLGVEEPGFLGLWTGSTCWGRGGSGTSSIRTMREGRSTRTRAGLPGIEGRGPNNPGPSGDRTHWQSIGRDRFAASPKGSEAAGQYEFVHVVDGNRVRIGDQSEAELHDGISAWIVPFARFQPQDVGLVQAAVFGQLIPGLSQTWT